MDEKKYHHGDLKNALIQAGVAVLARDGVNALSLREVARQAGVSHAAPYAHFTDKQALIAAIITEGYRLLYVQLESVVHTWQGDPHRQLVEMAWTYVQFAMQESDIFKIMFSGVLESEKNYPDFVTRSQGTFQLVVQVVQNCEQKGILKLLAPELMAVTVWGQVHGMISLIMMGQISHTVLEHYELRTILIIALNQLSLIPFVE
jgi:AcrR family transcriptional regulator